MPVLAAYDCKSRLSIDLLQVEHIVVGTDWNYSLCDNFNRIYYVMDGEGVIYTENETVVLKPNHVYVVPAMFPFRCKCDDRLEKVFVHVKCNVLPNRDILSNLDHIVDFPCTAEELEILKQTLYNHGICASLRLRLIIESMVLKLMEPLEDAFEYDYLLYRKFETFFSYTAANVHANLSIDEICYNIDMTPRQLTYQYKAATGHSVKSYLNALLLERIKYYLITTDRSLQDISEELRFSNEFYCSRFFKKGAGISPREYRQLHIDYRKDNLPKQK